MPGFGNSTDTGSNIDTPIDVTGGGGSSTTAQGAGLQATSTPSGLQSYMPYVMFGLLGVGLIFVLIFGMFRH